MTGSKFTDELTALLNRHSRENASNTPDFILATYLNRCLDAFNQAVGERADWYGRMDSPASLVASLIDPDPDGNHTPEGR